MTQIWQINLTNGHSNFLTQKMEGKNLFLHFSFLRGPAADTTVLKVRWWAELSDDTISPLLGKQ